MSCHQGKVILIGAGPGDPDLLTIKAARWLNMADVVLTDRLVSPAIIEEHTSPKAMVIPVGKQCRKGASTPQAFINRLMVEQALSGKLVVRLKGGDVSFFSNVLDELQALIAAGIPYEIVPGITAAAGAAAYSAIPLTARGYSTAVRFLTCYKSEVVSDQYWQELAATDDTLVFYMSAETLPDVVKNLVKYGIDPQKELAVVEQATTPFQKVLVSGLYDFQEKFENFQPVSPSLVIIGKVVSLHQSFRWLSNAISREEYFSPVEARLLNYEEEINLLTA